MKYLVLLVLRVMNAANAQVLAQRNRSATSSCFREVQLRFLDGQSGASRGSWYLRAISKRVQYQRVAQRTTLEMPELMRLHIDSHCYTVRFILSWRSLLWQPNVHAACSPVCENTIHKRVLCIRALCYRSRLSAVRQPDLMGPRTSSFG